MTDHEPGAAGSASPDPAAPRPGLPDPAGGAAPGSPGPGTPKQPGGPGATKRGHLPGGPGRRKLPGLPTPAPVSGPGRPAPPDLPVLHDQPTLHDQLPGPGQPAPLAVTAPVSPASPVAASPATASPVAASPVAASPVAASPVAGTAPAAATGGATQGTVPDGGLGGSVDLERLASLVSQRMAAGPAAAQPEPPPQMPSAEEAVLLREKAPELYDLWLKIAQDKATTDNYVNRAPYEVPERLAHSGRPRALGALVLVLAFGGYLASLGGPGPYIGGLIAILDLLIMVLLFFGLRPEHLSEPARPRKRRLVPPRAGHDGTPGHIRARGCRLG
jgi:hypothetical protein